jgi:spermidine synthase
MIELHRTRTAHGEVSIALHSRDGAVGYLKNGIVQTLIDARGRNLAVHVDAAVELLKENEATRVLVLGYGGGAASTMLHREGMDVVSVDCDPCAERLARLFFRAPPCLDVVVDDAANYVGAAAPASFDAVLVDFQDSAAIPIAYLSEGFWRASVRLLRPRGMLLANITEWLHLGPDWLVFRGALAAAGLGAVSLSEDFGSGNRLLIFSSVS